MHYEIHLAVDGATNALEDDRLNVRLKRERIEGIHQRLSQYLILGLGFINIEVRLGRMKLIQTSTANLQTSREILQTAQRIEGSLNDVRQFQTAPASAYPTYPYPMVLQHIGPQSYAWNAPPQIPPPAYGHPAPAAPVSSAIQSSAPPTPRQHNNTGRHPRKLHKRNFPHHHDLSKQQPQGGMMYNLVNHPTQVRMPVNSGWNQIGVVNGSPIYG
jgi:hypothetical protein